MPRTAGILLAAAAVVLLAWLAWQQRQTPPFVVSGFIEADQVRVGSQVGGRVAEVLVAEGDVVEAEALLYRLEPFELDAVLAQARSQVAVSRAEHARLSRGFREEEIEQARARLQRARARLDKALAGPRPQEVAMARERVEIARAASDLAETELARFAALLRQSQVSKEAYDRAVREQKAASGELAAAGQSLSLLLEGTRKEDIAVARADVLEAEQALALMQEGYRQEDVDKAAAQLAAAEASLAAVEARVAELEVRSPCGCVVEAIDLRPGDLVPANAPSVALLDVARLWVRTYVPEARLGQLQLGMRVPVRVDGLGERTFTGRITFLAQGGEFTPRNIQTPEERSKQVFRVKVTLDEALDRLRVGMAADVLFDEADPP